MRALWDGCALRHRSGRAVSAPASFLAALPPVPLDGELWLGRGRFDALSAIVRRVEPREAEWRAVRYMVFDMPVLGLPFATRLARLALLAPPLRAPIEVAPQWRVADRAELERALAHTVAGGGEGLMLHLAAAEIRPGPQRRAAEAEAAPPTPRPSSSATAWAAANIGTWSGALEVESAQGRRFFIGSGLGDGARRGPPPIGSTVTYRYRDLTSSGLPPLCDLPAPARRRLTRHRFRRRPASKAAAGRYFSGSAMKPIRVSPAFWTMPISSATRP